MPKQKVTRSWVAKITKPKSDCQGVEIARGQPHIHSNCKIDPGFSHGIPWLAHWSSCESQAWNKKMFATHIYLRARKRTNDFYGSVHEYRKLFNKVCRSQFPRGPRNVAWNCWKLQNESSKNLICFCLIESWGLCRSLIYSVVVSLQSILLLPRCCHSRGRKKSDEILLTMEAYCHTFWPNR